MITPALAFSEKPSTEATKQHHKSVNFIVVPGAYACTKITPVTP